METKRKKCKVILLPTKNYNNIPFIKNLRNTANKGQLFKTQPNRKYTDSYLKENEWEAQHLYIISDDEIQDGDWYYNSFDKAIRKNNTINHSYHHKIIATTDTSLNTKLHKGEVKDNTYPKYFGELPQPSKAFIEKYYKVGGIDEIMVEYNKSGGISHNEICDINCSYPNCYEEGILTIKINSHNEITIHPIKDTYNQIELFECMQYYMEYCLQKEYISPKEWYNNHKHF